VGDYRYVAVLQSGKYRFSSRGEAEFQREVDRMVEQLLLHVAFLMQGVYKTPSCEKFPRLSIETAPAKSHSVY